MIFALRRLLERSAKLTVLVSALAAVGLEAVLAARGWGPLLYWTVGAFVVALVLTAWKRRWGWGLILGTMYLVPVMFQALLGNHIDAYAVVWLAACLGGLLADQRSLEWSLPAVWRWPLAYWALAVALVWPVLIAREADFYWPLLDEYHIGNSGLGGPPAVVGVWMLQVALTHLLGVLWFDNAYRHRTFEHPTAFLRTVVAPLAIGAFLGSALAVYQGDIDINFWNGHQWPSLNRAAGSLMDGDAFGALAAMWTMLFPALGFALWRRSKAGVVLCMIGTALAWGGMWATGSRIALVGALVGLPFLTWIGFRGWWHLEARRRVVSAAAALVLVACVLGLLSRFENDNPLARTLRTMPEITVPALRKFVVEEFWNRNGPFGTMTVSILRQFPLTGVGIGSFNHLFTDLAFPLTGWNRHFFDNAQSWYRHQLAEMGWLGSIGWMIWVLTFTGVLVRTKAGPEWRAAALLVKAALLAIGLISAVSMPTQAFSLSMSVWMLAAWYLHMSPDAQARWPLQVPPTADLASWTAVWALALVFAGATAWTGWHQLRPPQRAVVAEWEYRYGFYDVEHPAAGSAYSWTGARAVDVFSVELKHWLKVTVRGGPPDIAIDPMRLMIWCRGALVVDQMLSAVEPHTWFIKIMPGEHHMMLEVRTSRVWRPVDFNVGTDSRVLGVQVEPWVFVESPPDGAEIR